MHRPLRTLLLTLTASLTLLGSVPFSFAVDPCAAEKTAVDQARAEYREAKRQLDIIWDALSANTGREQDNYRTLLMAQRWMRELQTNKPDIYELQAWNAKQEIAAAKAAYPSLKEMLVAANAAADAKFAVLSQKLDALDACRKANGQ